MQWSSLGEDDQRGMTDKLSLILQTVTVHENSGMGFPPSNRSEGEYGSFKFTFNTGFN